jgi:hypothetical protein
VDVYRVIRHHAYFKHGSDNFIPGVSALLALTPEQHAAAILKAVKP